MKSTKKANAKPAPKIGYYEKERIKKEAVIKDLAIEPNEENKAIAQETLTQYLEKNNKRDTVERRMVLDEIYGLPQPVDIATLLELIIQNHGLISQATVYNSLSLLVDAHLVRKIDLLQGGTFFYERVIGEEPHGFSVCCQCASIKRIPLAPLNETINKYLPKGFETNNNLLVVLGTCRKCQKKKSRK